MSEEVDAIFWFSVDAVLDLRPTTLCLANELAVGAISVEPLLLSRLANDSTSGAGARARLIPTLLTALDEAVVPVPMVLPLLLEEDAVPLKVGMLPRACAVLVGGARVEADVADATLGGLAVVGIGGLLVDGCLTSFEGTGAETFPLGAVVPVLRFQTPLTTAAAPFRKPNRECAPFLAGSHTSVSDCLIV
jgi:hypothetical protein